MPSSVISGSRREVLSDQNLPRHLRWQLRDVFPGSEQVTAPGPDAAADLRVGNAWTATVLQLLLDHVEVIEAFAVSEDEALLVLPTL